MFKAIGFFSGLGHLLLIVFAFPLWIAVVLLNGRKSKGRVTFIERALATRCGG